VVGLSTVAQYLYDVAQRLSHLRFGWLILGAVIGTRFAAAFLIAYTDIPTSNDLLSSIRWSYNYGNTMRVCVWNERLLSRSYCILDRVWSSFHHSAAPFCEETPEVDIYE
jgi:hypothetical protein